MSGFENSWLLLPLKRGALLSLLLALLCLSSALLERAAPMDTPEAAALGTETGDPAAAQTHAAWPHILLRLWFLAPQLTPLPAR